MEVTLEQVMTPRSFRPSSDFKIYTKSEEGYIVDSGGQDITVAMSTMNSMAGLQVEHLSKTNGAVDQYKFTLDSSIPLKDGDRVHFKLPEELSLALRVECRAADPPVGALAVSCSGVDKSVWVNLDELDRETGKFEFVVDGIKNAPSFRETGSFSEVYMQTSDFFSIQKLDSHDHLTVTNDQVALITEYEQIQDTEQYGEKGAYDLRFTPLNPISSDGTVKLTWSSDVEVFADAKCRVETYAALGEICEIDF